jgi:AcrR family transcriptional regulator
VVSENTQLRDDAIALELFNPKLTKSQQTQLRIVKAAIRQYSTVGFDSATFENIATAAGISRPLVQHYFSTREKLLLTSLKYIRSILQRTHIAAIQKSSAPKQQLSAYVNAAFDWLKHNPDQGIVWLLFYYSCALRPEWREINTHWVEMGHRRITELLEAGKRARVFKVADPSARAKEIQILITGALLAIGTESLPMSEASFRKQIVARCIDLASR